MFSYKNIFRTIIVAGLIALGFAFVNMTTGCAGSKYQACFIDCSNTSPQDIGTVTELNESALVTHCWTIDLTKLPERIRELLAGVDPREIIGRIIYVEQLTGQGCLGQPSGSESAFKFYTLESDKDASADIEFLATGDVVSLKSSGQ